MNSGHKLKIDKSDLVYWVHGSSQKIPIELSCQLSFTPHGLLFIGLLTYSASVKLFDSYYYIGVISRIIWRSKESRPCSYSRNVHRPI